jgi:hypothetical protein
MLRPTARTGMRTERITDLFCQFNEEHPGESTFPGGLWLSMGFLKDESLGAWQVDSSDMKFAFKKDSCLKN